MFELARSRIVWMIVLTCAVGSHPALGQDAAGVEIVDVQVGFRGLYKAGLWTPVTVTLKGGKLPVTGHLQLTVPDGDGLPSRVTSAKPYLVPATPTTAPASGGPTDGTRSPAISCENDRYGYHFQITKTPDFDPRLPLHGPDGKLAVRDVRTLPLLRFEDNESHGDGLFAFRFGDEGHGSVHGDREHPFMARNLRAREAHYVIRPNVQFFLLEGLRVKNAAFGIYHPDYDAHVYRDIEFDHVTAGPLNGGHDEESLPQGDFTYDRLTFTNCRRARDPLIQLTCIGPKPGLVGHFRGVTLLNSQPRGGSVVDFGGGPRTNKVDNPVGYFFHDTSTPSAVTRVANVKIPGAAKDAGYRAIDGWTSPDVRAAEVAGVTFPDLLAPVDDVPPATLITRITTAGAQRLVRGVSHDNGEIATVSVNGRPAKILAQQAGVADWSITLDAPADGRYLAKAIDSAGNAELLPHELREPVNR